MRLFRSKKIIKNLIIILSVLAILTSTFPNCVKAKTDTEDGGGILEPIEEFVLFLGDKVMGWLQNAFVSPDNIEVEEGVFEFKYSPAIIFSGEVPAFDINFIDPMPEKVGDVISSDYIDVLEALDLNGAVQVSSVMYSPNLNLLVTKNSCIKDIKENAAYEYDESREIDISVLEGKLKSSESEMETVFLAGTSFNANDIELQSAWFNTNKTKVYVIVNYISTQQNTSVTGDQSISIMKYIMLYELDSKTALEGTTGITGTTNATIGTKTYESTAGVLQNTIATWYNALRRIALVGLLSVLVYVGIRIVMSSASSEKAKYKAMLKDWLVAICLLFTLHYIMSITITVTNEISSIFQTGESDVLLNTLRQEIFDGADNLVVLAKVIMYVVLVILTVTFTIQYLKRVIFMAFYTLIAPLITLTYPLDKIKDGQAQAFNMWIKEYIYTALTQVIHLVIYFVLVGSALDLVADYPLYAIIVLAFMKKADGIIKKMFGFDKAETVGTLGAAATGGLIMSAINKISAKAGGKSGGSSGAKESASSTTVRTTSNDALASLRAGSGGNGGSLANSPSAGNAPAASSGGSSSESNWMKGAGAVAGKYGVRALKGTAKGVAKGFVGATGAMVGFASGVAQGDISAALTGAVAGGKAGSSLAGAGINAAKNIPGGIKNTINDLTDTWNQGAYGADIAQSKKEVRDFKSSSAYKALKGTFGDDLTDDKVSAMLDAGIKEEGDMEKVLRAGNINDAIGYYTLAKKCPDSIYYDDQKLQMYLEDLGLSQTDAKKMRENMRTYR